VTYAAGVEPVQVIRTQFVIRLSPTQQVVHHDHQRVGLGRHRPLPAPPRRHPLEVASLTEEADSLSIVELVMELEEEFEVCIPDDEAEQINTVAGAIRYIEQHRRE
jgi:hypothetical protein